MSDTIGFAPALPGDSDAWTPRQALLRALAECEKAGWKSVVIVGLTADDEIRGLNATPNKITRMGMLADALADKWEG